MFAGPLNIGIPPISYTSIPRPIYHYSVPLFGMITFLLYLLSIQFMLPGRRWRLQWSEILILFVVFLGFVSLITIGYYSTTHRYENIHIVTEEQPAVLIPEQRPLP